MKQMSTLSLSLLIVLSLLLAACGTATPTAKTEPTIAPVPTSTSIEPTAAPTEPTAAPVSTSTPAEPTPAALASIDLVFATFDEPPVAVVPAVQHEPIAADLSNVRVAFALSNDQRQRLGQDGFVVSPGVEKEFFTVYEKARYANVPIFVTSDSLLHVYHLLFDKVLRTAEVQYFVPFTCGGCRIVSLTP